MKMLKNLDWPIFFANLRPGSKKNDELSNQNFEQSQADVSSSELETDP
jgi:hypothetical protein